MENNNNLDFWNKYKEVPRNALKEFNNGRFNGTDINTMWRMKSLTESFGKAGFGWYFKPVRLWTETTPENEVFAFAEIELFIKEDGEWSMPISGTGGNKLLRNTRSGTMSSDEAYKMAITDAIGVACRNLGIGADVYWANDKTKYTDGGDNTSRATAEQIKKIKEVADVKGVLAYYGVGSLSDLRQEDAEFVIRSKS